MSDLLKIIIKQNAVNEKLLQYILLYLGIDRKCLRDELDNIIKQVDREINNYE